MGRSKAPYHSSGRHRRVPHLRTRQGHCSGARREGRGCRRNGGEGCTYRCLSCAPHIHTHIHLLCRRRRNMQVPCLARARAFTECARAHAQSVLGGAGLQVLNVASRRTRTLKVILIWRWFRKVPSTSCVCVVLPYARIYNHIAYIAYLAYFLYLAYIFYVLH